MVVRETYILDNYMGMRMMGMSQILQESGRDENRCCGTPGMETNAAGLSQGKRNVDMKKLHLTVMLLFLCIQ